MKTHKNHLRLLILLLLVLLACAGYMTVGVHFENQKLFAYAMRIRTPKLIAMLITAFAIGSASIVFQSMPSLMMIRYSYSSSLPSSSVVVRISISSVSVKVYCKPNSRFSSACALCGV
jgi:ABC-type enterochelin transport system permease subunit